MRIFRPDQNWCVQRRGGGEAACLQRLALRCGYRVKDLCAALGCGERHLLEVFRRDVGLSPKAWLRQERMVVARRKLAGGVAPAMVAEDLGFSCLNNFRKEFVRVYRVRPAEFQRAAWNLARRASSTGP